MSTANNELREQSILAAAAALFVHYGYDKTTVSDIAREAGVSKGAIYLHFKSKDELIEALIIRETRAYAEKWLDLINDDPKGGTIGGMYKNMLYALSASDFMAAAFRRDGRILGRYLRKPGNFFQTTQTQVDTRYEFVRKMQEAGAVRTDIDAKVIVHIMNMLGYGLVAIEEIIPEDNIPPVDDVIEGIALIMDSALTPTGGGDSAAGKAIINQIAHDLRQIVTIGAN